MADEESIDAEEPDLKALDDAPSKAELALPRGGGSLARQDPLALYMRDVERYKMLSPEDEARLARSYFETGDVDAAKHLVTSNLRLVVKIAYEYRRAYKNILDLVQEGNIGLMQAVRKYDPFKGVKLSSYAAWWIRAYILRFILNNHHLVKLGTTQSQRKLFFNLNKEKARLSAMGIEPSAEVIAKNLDVPLEDVRSMDLRLSSGEASLDAPLVRGDGEASGSRMDSVAAPGIGADEALGDHEVDSQVHEKLAEFRKTLSGKDLQIFDQRLLSDEPKTLQDLGDEFGVSRERVRQLEKRILTKLKAYLRGELGDQLIEIYEQND